MTTKLETLYGKKFFVVNTGINQSAYRPGITSLKVKDDEGNDAFMMSICMTAEAGSIENFGITVNGITDDGDYVILIPVCDDIEVEDLKKAFGAKLVKAAGYIEQLKSQMTAEAQAVDAIFADIQ